MQSAAWTIVGMACLGTLPIVGQDSLNQPCRDLKSRTDRISVAYNPWAKTPPPSPLTAISILGAGHFEKGTLAGGSDYLTERAGCMARLLFDAQGAYGGVRFTNATTLPSHVQEQLQQVNNEIRDLQKKLEVLERFREALAKAGLEDGQEQPSPSSAFGKSAGLNDNAAMAIQTRGYSIDDGSLGAVSSEELSKPKVGLHEVVFPRVGGGPKPSQTGQSSHNASRASRGAGRTYYTGPRGGCYWIGSTGRKNYVDRSMCD